MLPNAFFFCKFSFFYSRERARQKNRKINFAISHDFASCANHNPLTQDAHHKYRSADMRRASAALRIRDRLRFWKFELGRVCATSDQDATIIEYQ